MWTIVKYIIRIDHMKTKNLDKIAQRGQWKTKQEALAAAKILNTREPRYDITYHVEEMIGG